MWFGQLQNRCSCVRNCKSEVDSRRAHHANFFKLISRNYCGSRNIAVTKSIKISEGSMAARNDKRLDTKKQQNVPRINMNMNPVTERCPDCGANLSFEGDLEIFCPNGCNYLDLR